MTPRSLLVLALLLDPVLPAAADEPAAELVAGTDPAAAGLAADDAIDRTPKSCLSRGGLRKTTIADDRTVLFIRHKDVYINVLRRSCPGLTRADGIAYHVRGGRTSTLCRGDLIYPTGLNVGCPLGPFYEISAAQALALLNPTQAWSLDNVIEFEPIPRP